MKDVVAYVVSLHGYSERGACQVTLQHRSTQRKPSTRDPRTEVRQRMHEIVATRIRYGYRRVHVMLKREGWQVGRNVVYRLYREEGLVLRTKQPRRRKMTVHREIMQMLDYFLIFSGENHRCFVSEIKSPVRGLTGERTAHRFRARRIRDVKRAM